MIITAFGKFRNREEIRMVLDAFSALRNKRKFLLAPGCSRLPNIPGSAIR